jgi:hypothetical protein
MKDGDEVPAMMENWEDMSYERFRELSAAEQQAVLNRLHGEEVTRRTRTMVTGIQDRLKGNSGEPRGN